MASNTGLGSANVTALTATVAIDWAWGSNTVVPFDPNTDTVFVGWLSADHIEVSETAAGVVIAVPSNNSSTTLSGVTLAGLSPSNFTFLDATAAQEVLSLVGTPSGGVAPPVDDGAPADGGMPTPSEGGMPGHGGMHDHGDMPGNAVMTMINLTTPSRTINDFSVARGDMLHIEGGVTGERFSIFEESGDALGLTTRVVVTDDGGNILSTTILVGVGLSDLTLANFSVAEQSALNEVAAAIGQTITTPGTSTNGFSVVYDSDNSAPPTTADNGNGGVNWIADFNKDDIVGFNAATDTLDFGNNSVHGMIINKSPQGEVIIDSPWSAAMQIVQGVTYQQLDISNFGIVGNEHFRQDIGGVLSWELGIGPRETDTVYVRSHEYGVSEVVNNFDPSTMKLSFLYFGTRERLQVEDTTDGLVISSLPSGQSLTLTGVSLADLVPGRVEFHHDQVVEDNLEVPFGWSADQVTLVDRTPLLTPQAPPGATTDGFQTRLGDLSSSPPSATPSTDPTPPSDAPPPPPPAATPGPNTGPGTDTISVTWKWAAVEVISGFDPSADVIDLGNVAADQLNVSAASDGDVILQVLNNGGQEYRFDGVTANDLNSQNVTAASWNNDAVNAILDDLAGF